MSNYAPSYVQQVEAQLSQLQAENMAMRARLVELELFQQVIRRLFEAEARLNATLDVVPPLAAALPKEQATARSVNGAPRSNGAPSLHVK